MQENTPLTHSNAGDVIVETPIPSIERDYGLIALYG